MSAYLVVRNHPNGGFAVVRADTDDNQIPAVEDKYHLQFGTLRLACKAAHEEATELGDIGYYVHEESYRA